MTDGLNQVRAMRITEIMGDFRNIQNYISSVRISPSGAEANEPGYMIIRHCSAESQALLQQAFPTQKNSGGDVEADKLQLRRIIADAAVRRFKAQKIYLKATAALRWVNARAAILRGHRPSNQHVPALQQINATLRQELASITDQRVEMSLRSADASAGKWTNEDPALHDIQRFIASGGVVKHESDSDSDAETCKKEEVDD